MQIAAKYGCSVQEACGLRVGFQIRDFRAILSA
jgi:hypothetical protein